MTNYDKKEDRKLEKIKQKEMDEIILNFSGFFTEKICNLMSDINKEIVEKYPSPNISNEIIFKSFMNTISWAVMHFCDAVIDDNFLEKKLNLIDNISNSAKLLCKVRQKLNTHKLDS